MSELGEAIALADRILDTPNIDPDGALCVLARNLNRVSERAAKHLMLIKTGAHEPEVLTDREAFFRDLITAMDPEGVKEGRYGF